MLTVIVFVYKFPSVPLSRSGQGSEIDARVEPQPLTKQCMDGHEATLRSSQLF